MILFGLFLAVVMRIIWILVDSINSLKIFNIDYPSNKDEQKIIANGFAAVSSVGFQNYASCADGILIWIQQPSEEESNKASIGRKSSSVAGKINLD